MRGTSITLAIGLGVASALGASCTPSRVLEHGGRVTDAPSLRPQP